MYDVEFESLSTNISAYLYRAKVPGGWLVTCTDESPMTVTDYGYDQKYHTAPIFIADPTHSWEVGGNNGGSI